MSPVRLFLLISTFAVTLAAGGAGAATSLPRSVALTTGWAFQADPLDLGLTQGWQRPDFDRRAWRTVAVPSAWDGYSVVMDGYEGVGWFAIQIPSDKVIADSWQRLRFGRVNHRATVWIDGVRVAEDSLGYLPFEVAATPHVTPGHPAWIVVRVENGARYDWLPGTTTVEWVQYGGLLEPVELLTTSRAYIARVSVDARPRGKDARAIVTVDVENASDAAFDGSVHVTAAGRRGEAPLHVVAHGHGAVSFTLTIARPRLWSPEHASLYDLDVRLQQGGHPQDAVADRFGVRSIEARGRELLLNGRPLRIRGVNRYNEYPDHGPVATDAAIRADLRAIQAAGANLVRVHFPQTPATLRIADELGLLFMEEVPLNWWRARWHPAPPPEYRNDAIIDSAEQALERLVARDANHPSIVIWSVANECRSDDSLGIRAMTRLLARAHALDSTRLVTYVANHSFEQNAAFAGADLVAINLYYGMWDGAIAEREADLETRVHLATRDKLTEIAGLFPAKPILLSEFGTIGLPGSAGDVRFSEDYQAAYVSSVWQALRDHDDVCGGIVWSWADYRHRRGFTNDFPTYFGPFGLVTLDRRPKRALAALRTMWREDAKR